VQAAAPGVQVPAQGRDGQYWLVSGTSPACALTAGVAALIRSAYPGLPPDLVRDAITTTTSNRPARGYDYQVGFGTVNAAAALTAAAQLSARGLAGPGSPRTGLRRTRATDLGSDEGSRFGGGPAAVPPEPVGPRSLGQLLLFCALAAGCLAMIVVATSRLILMRRPAAAAENQQHGLVTPGGTWSGLTGEPRPPDRPQDGSHLPVPPRFPWPAAPPGRHAVPQDPPEGSAAEGSAAGGPAAGGPAAGSSAAGPGE
jgi:hypothetical protein